MSYESQRCTDDASRRARDEELALLAGGDLPPDEAAHLERHAESCPACGATLAGLRQSLAALSLLAEEDLAPERPAERAALERVRAGVLAGAARIERERSDVPAGGAGALEESGHRHLRWALAAVLLVALLGAAVWLRPDRVPAPEGPQPERLAERPVPAPAPAPVQIQVQVQEPPEEPASPPEAPASSEGVRGPAPPDRLARAAGAPEAEPLIPDAPIHPNARAGDSSAGPAAPSAEAQPAEPRITIRIVSDDPDIVFYWLVEPEENRDETVSS